MYLCIWLLLNNTSLFVIFPCIYFSSDRRRGKIKAKCCWENMRITTGSTDNSGYFIFVCARMCLCACLCGAKMATTVRSRISKEYLCLSLFSCCACVQIYKYIYLDGCVCVAFWLCVCAAVVQCRHISSHKP